MQMLFDKINNGSPFGVIREVFSFSPQLRQFLNNKCHFISLPPLQTTVEIEEHRDILYQRGFLYTDRRLKE
ncbi:hypothetical protein VN1288_04480 [Helicobacter pylori]|nr:hypothetical protein VN1288_04480 [Helicobacter pylori]